MNERILELASQCIDQRWTVTGPMFDREKFAELIVKECAKVLWDSNDILGESRIKKHFGVEE
jgi:hypothetical protein